MLGDVVLASLAYAQAEIISLAMSGKDRISPWRMWGMLAVVALAAVVSGRFPR